MQQKARGPLSDLFPNATNAYELRQTGNRHRVQHTQEVVHIRPGSAEKRRRGIEVSGS